MDGAATIPAGMRPRQREGCACRVLDDEAAVYDPAHDVIHYLNRTAYFLWERCDGSRDAAMLTDALADAFDVDAVTVRDDVEETLAMLAENGLIDRENGKA